MPLTSYYSASDVRALPDDGKRYETVHGELLVTPAPAPHHQVVLQRLNRVIDQYLVSHGIEDTLMSPADISFGEDTLVQPDFFVADLSRVRQTNAWSDVRTLYLAVEVLSPSSARADRFTKRRLYQEQRVGAYWIADSVAHQVEVWTPDAIFPDVQHERLTWRHPLIAEDCVVLLEEVFRGIEGSGAAAPTSPP